MDTIFTLLFLIGAIYIGWQYLKYRMREWYVAKSKVFYNIGFKHGKNGDPRDADPAWPQRSFKYYDAGYDDGVNERMIKHGIHRISK